MRASDRSILSLSTICLTTNGPWDRGAKLTIRPVSGLTSTTRNAPSDTMCQRVHGSSPRAVAARCTTTPGSEVDFATSCAWAQTCKYEKKQNEYEKQ